MTPDDRDRTEHPGAPRWVKLLIAAAVVLAALAIVALLAGGGHGPGRHL